MSCGAGSAFGGKKLLFVVPMVMLMSVGCNSSPKQSQEQAQSQEQIQQAQEQKPTDQKVEQTSNSWTGVLKNSDNQAKGNLMLVTADHTVYIHTSRDFSSLIGKNVKVAYTDTLESFVLGDITAE